MCGGVWGWRPTSFPQATALAFLLGSGQESYQPWRLCPLAREWRGGGVGLWKPVIRVWFELKELGLVSSSCSPLSIFGKLEQ